LWSFGAVDAEHARFTSAFAFATVDACAVTTAREVRMPHMPHMPHMVGATWKFGDQEPIFLGVPHTSKGMKAPPCGG